MKFNLMSVTMFTVGAILIWAALKDIDPRILVQNTLQGKPTGSGKQPAPKTHPGPSPVPGHKPVSPFQV